MRDLAHRQSGGAAMSRYMEERGQERQLHQELAQEREQAERREATEAPSPPPVSLLEPDTSLLRTFIEVMFRHASPDGYIAFRGIGAKGLYMPEWGAIKHGVGYLTGIAEDLARRCANETYKCAFCPPVCTFANYHHAREEDLLEGLAISIELDEHPQAGRAKLEQVLGPPTAVVISGGVWTDPVTGQVAAKLHVHWRLKTPAREAALTILKEARGLATAVSGADRSNKTVVHPLRWPGSIHRKAEPVMCRFEVLNADTEIDLDAALAALRAAAPPEHVNGGGSGGLVSGGGTVAGCGLDGDEEWITLRNDILEGNRLQCIADEPGRQICVRVTNDAAIVDVLRDLMDRSAGPRDERFWERYHRDLPGP